MGLRGFLCSRNASSSKNTKGMQNPRNFGRGPDFGGFNSFYKKNMPNCNLQYAIITQHKEM
jgi:hypothetical protein